MLRLCLLIVFLGISNTCYGDVFNNKVDRTIDVMSQLVKLSTKITLENTGPSPVTTFFYALEPETKAYLAHISASQVQDDGKAFLKMEEVTHQQVNMNKDKDLYKIHLRNPLQGGRMTIIRVDSIFTHMLQPYPSKITQSEKQLVLYHGSSYFYSPYVTRSQTTTINTGAAKIESYTKMKQASDKSNVVTYGPYENISPYSLSKIIVHYDNNNHFLTVTELHRAIEVSHWGIVSIEELVDIAHTGALLKGPFSRYEFQRDQSGIASVKSFKTVLPASASDVYYRDEIGNISTSHLRILEDSVEVELRPRFPLFGGWKTHYTLGYNVPAYEYLYNNGDQFVLKMRFVDHIYDDSVIDHAVVRVILPEGSKNIQVKLPYSVERMPDELHYTYLDTIGRPVIVLKKSNLVEQHIQDFEVHYDYQKFLMLQEPFLVVIALYLLFLVVIIYVRLDFTITKDPLKDNKLKISGHIEAVHSHHDKRTEIYARFDEALSRFKHNKDLANYQSTLKKLNNEYKVETQAITDLMGKLKHDGSDDVEKVSELQKLDKTLKDLLHQQTLLVEKLIGNKTGKQQYLDADSSIVKKKEEAVEKMQAITSHL